MSIEVKDIIYAVAQSYGIRPHHVLGGRRERMYALPRHVSMYIARRLTPLSYPDIARAMGGLDHTTVMHGVRKIALLATKDVALATKISDIESVLLSGADARAA